MKYTVTWKPRALRRLADIWLAAADKEAVSRAVNRIDRHLEQHAYAGQIHLYGTTLIVAPPLVVAYEVSHPDYRASVLSVAYRP